MNQIKNINHDNKLIKICGITNQSDLDACMSMGAGYCGFVFHPDSTRCISVERAARMQSGYLKRVGVFVHQEANEILDIMDRAQLDYAQLNGNQSIECARQIGFSRVIRFFNTSHYESTEELMTDMRKHEHSCALFMIEEPQQQTSLQHIDWKKILSSPLKKDCLLSGSIFVHSNDGVHTHNIGVNLNKEIEWAPGHKSKRLMLRSVSQISSLMYDQLNESAIFA